MKYLKISLLLALIIGTASSSCNPQDAEVIGNIAGAVATQYRLDIELVHSNSSSESEVVGIGGTEDEVYFIVQQLDLDGTQIINSSSNRLHPPTDPDIIRMGGEPGDTNDRVKTTLFWDVFGDGRLTEIILIVAEQDNAQQSLIESLALGAITGGVSILVDELIGDGMSKEEVKQLKEVTDKEVHDRAESIINALREDKDQDLGVVAIAIGNPKDDDRTNVQLKVKALVDESTRLVTEEPHAAVFALSGFDSRYDLRVSLEPSGESEIPDNFVYVDQSDQACSRERVRIVDRDGNDVIIEKGITKGVATPSNEVVWYCESDTEQNEEGPIGFPEGINYVQVTRQSTGRDMTFRAFHQYKMLYKSPTD